MTTAPQRSHASSQPPLQLCCLPVALLPWGDVVEDFLDGIGVSLGEFSSRMTGGWLFGYIDALKLQGIRTTIVCFSERVMNTTLGTEPTGAELVILRAPAAYRVIRRSMSDPCGCSMRDVRRQERTLASLLACRAPSCAVLATPLVALARNPPGAMLGDPVPGVKSPRFDAAVMIGRLLRIPVFGAFKALGIGRAGDACSASIRRSAGLVIGAAAGRPGQDRYGVPTGKVWRIFNPIDLSELAADGTARHTPRSRDRRHDSCRHLARSRGYPEERARRPPRSVAGRRYDAPRSRYPLDDRRVRRADAGSMR